MALATCPKCFASYQHHPPPLPSFAPRCQGPLASPLTPALDHPKFHSVPNSIRRSSSCSCCAVKSLIWWGVQKPERVELQAITSEAHFDQILSEAQQSKKGVVIDWMALWCRKCIYLKPKLEKLGGEFYPDFEFYFVDINSVPKSLVDRAGVTKMPTIQLWRNGEKRGEVIGGHKAWLVIDEISEMLKKNKA